MAANTTTTVFGSQPNKLVVDKSKSKVTKRCGLGFPLGKNKTNGGFFARRCNEDTIRDAVTQLIKTEPGERLMLPNYGCSLRKYLFEPINEITFVDIKRSIYEAFTKYIVGATLVKIRIESLDEIGPTGGNALKVSAYVRLDAADLTVIKVEVDIE